MPNSARSRQLTQVLGEIEEQCTARMYLAERGSGPWAPGDPLDDLGRDYIAVMGNALELLGRAMTDGDEINVAMVEILAELATHWAVELRLAAEGDD